MKKLLIILLVVFPGSFFGQGNLQFNQVLNFTGVISVANGGVNSAAQTVPTGKVWKIEHTGGFASNASSSNARYGISINGAFAAIYLANSIDQNICPIWLREGDNVQFFYAHQSAGTNTCSYVISIVEFNVIP